MMVERTMIEMPEAPNAVCVMGCDAANGRYFQLYTDDRNVCRVYEMSIGDGEWKLWREGEPFNQASPAASRTMATRSTDAGRPTRGTAGGPTST